MKLQDVTMVYPGDLNTLTGGYLYDKRIVEGLREQTSDTTAWQVHLVSLEGDYPFPNEEQLRKADQRLEHIADHSLVIFDGLAYSVMPDVIARHAQRLKFVALIHHPLALETGLSTEQSHKFQTLEIGALQYAQHVITTSELTASSLTKYDVPEQKITAIMPGTDESPLAHGSNADIMNLLCVATLTQRKGHRILLDALSTIKKLPWHLHCVGSTERDKNTYVALQEQCQKLDLLERVTFVGELETTELQQYYLQADLFVLASYHEGYGMVLSEAIARGLPIIGSNAGAMRQTVPDEAGLLVAPGDALALASALNAFMQDPQLRTRLRTGALSAREQLRSWQQATQEFSAILTQIQTTSQTGQ